MSGGRPQPVPDGTSGPFWEAASRHTLSIARCSRCGTFAHPPDDVCPHCGATDPGFVFTAVDGSGRIRSWTVMHQSFLVGFDADLPFVLVDVELCAQPGLRLIGRLIDGPGVTLGAGAAVHICFEDVADGVAVPAFALADRP